MSIVQIEHAASNTFGVQARAYVAKGHRPERLTAFFAYDAHGGRRAAKRAAEQALPILQWRAARLRWAFMRRPADWRRAVLGVGPTLAAELARFDEARQALNEAIAAAVRSTAKGPR